MIEVEGLVKTFGGNTVVKGFNLTLQDNEIVSLLGPSGCGKTTTLRCIAGLETPTAGRITFDGRELFGPGVDVPAHQRRMGMVFQNYAIWPHMTVFDNVAYPLKVSHTPVDERADRINSVLHKCGLSGLGRRYPSEISGGQQQRVALARALVSDPHVILYDEPLSNLDAKLRNEMRYLLRSLHDSLGTAAIYVTHDQQEAMVLADRICLMHDGVLVQEGTARDLYEKPVDRFASDFLGVENLFEVSKVDRANHRAELAAGHSLDVSPSAPYWGQESELDDSTWLSIRAQDVRIDGPSQTRNPGNEVSGEVEHATYLGDRVRYALAVDGVGMVIADDFTAAEPHPAGAVVRLRFPVERCMLLRPESSRELQTAGAGRG